MAGAPLLTLLHASPPPASMPAHLASASGDVSLAAGDPSLDRPVDNRVSRSDESLLPPETTTTVAPATTTPTPSTAAQRARRVTTTTKPAVRAVQKAPVRQAPPTTAKAASKPAAKPAPKSSPSGSSTAPSGRSQSGGATWYDAAPPGTCAHRTLPMGTIVTIRSSSGATASCRVADRGPFVDGLIIDLAKDVFSRLAPLGQGVVQVTISW